MQRRVVITGMGAVTSLGLDVPTFWQAIKQGENGITHIERIDTSDLPTKVAAEIKDFDPCNFMDKKEAKRTDRFSQYAMAATKQALDDAKLDKDFLQKETVGLIIGSGIGGLETLETQHEILLTKGADRISPFLIPMMLPNMAAGMTAIKFGIKGFVECTVSACASATNAIGDAFKIIQRADADIMIAGGTEAPITRLAMAGFCANKAMTRNVDIETACRPFDRDRDGFVMGEGAGIIVLEELEHAKKRGANIIAELVGYGCTNDAYHITAVAPGGEGGARCMQMALEDAKIEKTAIQYINAHGTSTGVNDKGETQAIKEVFKDHAYQLAISSTKSMTGHLLGAAGGIEAIITALALHDGFVPPTIHYHTADVDCDLNYTANIGHSAGLEYGLSNSFGFGGHNATLIFRKYQPEL